MTRRVQIRMNVANALQWLGTLYRNPAEAIKEHVSNAVDEHLKAVERGYGRDRCVVQYRFTRKDVTIEYPYGMSREEFESALQRVADSAKRHSKVAQIGQLGIGIFSFQQIGRKCIFLSRKDQSSPTIRVTLREAHDEAEFDAALKRESLDTPGVKIIISELKLDPTKTRGPLAPDRLSRLFAEKFASYLQKGWLEIHITSGSEKLSIKPPRIDLPRIGKGLEKLWLGGPPGHLVRLELYFDSSGKGTVGIRHAGVVVVESIADIHAYGLEDSVYASGYVRGFIDADFLRPLPARSGFDETAEWVKFLDLLDRYRSQIEAEVEELKSREEERELSEVQQRALQLAREILELDEFRDLELPGGLARARSDAQQTGRRPEGERTGERSKEAGDHPSSRGPRIDYQEIAFPDGSMRHSKYVTGVVLANTLNADYQREASGSPDSKLAYAALLIGKEAIAFNDKSGAADEQLERMLSFHYELKRQMVGRSPAHFAKRRRKI